MDDISEYKIDKVNALLCECLNEMNLKQIKVKRVVISEQNSTVRGKLVVYIPCKYAKNKTPLLLFEMLEIFESGIKHDPLHAIHINPKMKVYYFRGCDEYEITSRQYLMSVLARCMKRGSSPSSDEADGMKGLLEIILETLQRIERRQ